MKYQNLASFEKHLQSASPHHFAPLYLILTNEEFQKNLAHETLDRHLKSSPFQKKIFDMKDLTQEVLSQELETESFFSKNEVIILNQGDSMRQEIKSLLEEYLDRPNLKKMLFLFFESLSSNTNLYKKIEKVGIILDLSRNLKPWEKERELKEWLIQEAKKRAKRLSNEGVHLLLQQIGANDGLLFQELQKLILYVGERDDILPKDVQDVCLSFPHGTIWQLREAILLKNTALSLKIGRELLSQSSLLALLKQIRGGLQMGLQILDLTEQGRGGEISKLFPYLQGPSLDRHLQMAKNFGHKSLKTNLILIDHTEIEAKNSTTSEEILLELLLIKLTLR